MADNKPRRQRGKWRIRWRDHTGKRRSQVYASYDEAEIAVERYELRVKEIQRGFRAAPGRLPTKTFDDLFDYWLEHRAPHKRSGGDDASIIRAHLRPAFGPIQLREFSPAHVDAFRAERRHLSNSTICNLLTLLVTMLNLAKNELYWLESVPKIRKPRRGSKPYHYLETKDDVRRFLAAAREEREVVHVCYALATYTGMRAGELAALRWSDVDFDRRLITVSRSFDKTTTKSGVARHASLVRHAGADRAGAVGPRPARRCGVRVRRQTADAHQATVVGPQRVLPAGQAPASCGIRSAFGPRGDSIRLRVTRR